MRRGPSRQLGPPYYSVTIEPRDDELWRWSVRYFESSSCSTVIENNGMAVTSEEARLLTSACIERHKDARRREAKRQEKRTWFSVDGSLDD